VNKRIQVYVNELFTDVPGDQYISDIKEELLSNLCEKYDDLISEGKNEEEAYTLVIASIGDINDLINNGEQYGHNTPEDIEKKRNIKSVFLSIGGALFILSLAALFVLNAYGYTTIGIGALIVICAIATGFITYGANIEKDKYKKADDTFVENYKEKFIEKDRISKMKRAVSSALWPSIVVVYFAVSFITQMWSVTWIIFLVGVFIQQFVFFLLSKHEGEKPNPYGMIWSVTVVIYLVVSFAFNAWQWSWIIFLGTVAIQEIIKLLTVWKRG
jgi:hypothetical protein